MVYLSSATRRLHRLITPFSSMSSGLSHAFVQYENNDHGSSVVVGALISLVAMLPFAVTRIILAATLARDKSLVHGLYLFATVTASLSAIYSR